MSTIRTAAILSLFRDGFHLEDLAEIFGLGSRDIQALLRIALTEGRSTTPPSASHSVAPKSKPVLRRKPGPKRNLAPPVANVVPVKPPKRTGECEQHAGAGVTKRDECRGCLRAYQADWNSRRKKAAPKVKAPRRPPERKVRPAPSEPTPTEDLKIATSTVGAAAVEEFTETHREVPQVPSVAPDGKVFSHPIQCPKCSQRHRFWKRANADDSRDHWISLGCNNSLKIAHYQIKVDRHYQGNAA